MNNEINPKVLEDLKQQREAIINVRNSRRTQEEIIKDLSFLIKDLSKETFIPYLFEMMIHIDQRNTSEAFKHLMSPMKQFAYLIDLFFPLKQVVILMGFQKKSG